MLRTIFGAWRPRLVSLFVLFLAPVVIVAGADSASAATQYSAPVQTSFTFDDWRPGAYGTCNVAGYYAVVDGQDQSVNLKTNCDLGWNAYDLEVAYTLNGVGGCTAGTFITGVNDDGGPYGAAPGTDLGCHVIELCYVVTFDDWRPGSGEYGSGCVPFDLGEPPLVPPVPNGCPVWNPTGHAFVTNTAPPDLVNGVYRQTFKMPWAKGSIAGANSDGVTVMVWFRNQSGALAKYESSNWRELPGNGYYTLDVTAQGGWPVAEPSKLVGVQYVTDGWYHSYPPQRNYALRTAGQVQNLGGVTWPEACSFYWGEKIASDANTEYDEPAGPMGTSESGGGGGSPTDPDPEVTPPAGQSDACNFSWSDPAGWASAGICAMVELVARLIDLAVSILDFLGGLLASLGELLLDLFVPDEGAIRSAFADVREAWEDRGPGAWVTALAEMDLPSGGASGCQGPHVDVAFGEGIGFDTYPLNACSGVAATLAGLCKAIISVTVVWFGGLRCVRAIGSGFNWSAGGGSAS